MWRLIMGIDRSTLRIELLLVLAIYSLSLASAQQKPSTSGSKGSSGPGRSLFNSTCAACHGLDGRGSDKAVNISGSDRVRKYSDAQLSNIVSNGIPETGMPAFRTLNATQIHAIVAYLRSLQGKSQIRTLPGDPKRGKEIFFGKGECSSCHSISGQGGFLGPDLTEYAATSSVEAIREEIIRMPRTPAMGYRKAAVTTASGDRMEGIVRNEDNFSLQLQTIEGSFHFFKKVELRGFERLDGSLMPVDYRDRLNEGELNDLASFLLTTPRADKNLSQIRKGYEDE
jgi:cytochrome c oxidase cbb3-type subunit III